MRIKCDFFRVRVMAQFSVLEDYRSHMEAQIQESHHSTRSQILRQNRTPRDMSDEDVREWFCLRDEEIDECDRRFAVDFRRILRFTLLMRIFTLVESSLSLLAQEIKKRKGLALDMEDLQAKNLMKQFRKFWTKVAGLPWWSDPRWDWLQDIQQLRNCIAHRNGVVRENDRRINQLLGGDRGVRLVGADDPLADPDEAGTLEIEERFCREAVEQMTALFNETFNRAQVFGPDHIVGEPE